MKRIAAALLLLSLDAHASRIPFEGSWARHVGNDVVRLYTDECENKKVLRFVKRGAEDSFKEGAYIHGREVVRFCWAGKDGVLMLLAENGKTLFISEKDFSQELPI